MISKLLFSLALLAEAASWMSLPHAPDEAQMLLVYLLSHGLASVALALGVWRLLPARYRQPTPWSPLLIFSLAFFIPLLGTIGVVVAIFPALYLPKPRNDGEAPWQAVAIPALPFRAQERIEAPTFNDGGLLDVLHHASDDEHRLEALMATRRMSGREAIPILKLALSDSSDDIRLLAYSMLDRQETQINQRIQNALGHLPTAEAESLPILHAQLAGWYWELAYLGLAQGSVLEHVLASAAEHARLGIESHAGPNLHLLAGRIALQQHDLATAQYHFDRAVRQGIDTAAVAPYRAELAFQSGHYQDIPTLLADLPQELLNRPPFTALARCWL